MTSFLFLFSCKKDNYNTIENKTNENQFTSLEEEDLFRINFLNSVGELHNEYQEFIYSKLLYTNIPIGDNQPFYDSMFSWSELYFSLNNLESDSFIYSNIYDWDNEMDDYPDIDNLGLGEEASIILEELYFTLDNIKEFDLETRVKLDDLFEETLKIQNFDEFLIVGSMISTAKYSFAYWNENTIEWEENLNVYNNTPSTFSQGEEKKTVNTKEVLKADATGAIVGGIKGIPGGAPGVLTNAVVRGSRKSAINILKQIAKNNL